MRPLRIRVTYPAGYAPLAAAELAAARLAPAAFARVLELALIRRRGVIRGR